MKKSYNSNVTTSLFSDLKLIGCKFENRLDQLQTFRTFATKCTLDVHKVY